MGWYIIIIVIIFIIATFIIIIIIVIVITLVIIVIIIIIKEKPDAEIANKCGVPVYFWEDFLNLGKEVADSEVEGYNIYNYANNNTITNIKLIFVLISIIIFIIIQTLIILIIVVLMV